MHRSRHPRAHKQTAQAKQCRKTEPIPNQTPRQRPPRFRITEQHRHRMNASRAPRRQNQTPQQSEIKMQSRRERGRTSARNRQAEEQRRPQQPRHRRTAATSAAAPSKTPQRRSPASEKPETDHKSKGIGRRGQENRGETAPTVKSNSQPTQTDPVTPAT